jgi:hypothetical protein
MLLRFRWPLAALTLSLVLVLVMPAPAKASACDLLNQLGACTPSETDLDFNPDGTITLPGSPGRRGRRGHRRRPVRPYVLKPPATCWTWPTRSGPGWEHRVTIGHDADVAHDRPHRLRAEVLVLGREGVDGRGDEADPLVTLQPVGDVGSPREDDGGGLVEVGPKKSPRPGHQLVGPVAADVTAPDRRGAGPGHRAHQPGGLRIVQHHHVPWAQEGRQLLGVGP